MEVDGERVAAYRNEAGVVHAVSPVCGHMGCVVTWNHAETTWDCPCHGSRDDHSGRSIQGPTVRDLEPKPQSHLQRVDRDRRSPNGGRRLTPEWRRESAVTHTTARALWGP